MLHKFKLHCKNKESGCDEILTYENLERHENTCTSCLLCKVKCTRCNEILWAGDMQAHKCAVHKGPVENLRYVGTDNDVYPLNYNIEVEGSFSPLNELNN